MNTCVRCGTQFAVGEDRCPFCSLPVAGDADVTRAASDPSGGQQWPGQQPGQPASGQGPWQQPGPQGQPGQQWQGGQPGGPYQGGQQGGPYQGGQPWQGQQPMAGGPPGGGWQGPPAGGQPWQQGGGVPPKKGMNPGVLIAVGVAVLLVLGLGAWGLVAAFSGDDEDTTAGGDGDQTSESASPTESTEPSPTEESSATESAEPTPTEGPTENGGGGGSDVVEFDLSTTDQAAITVTVSSPGSLTISAESDIDQDIVMVVNDPDGTEVCNEDASFFEEECTFQAEVGEYEVLVTPYDDSDEGGTGKVRIS